MINRMVVALAVCLLSCRVVASPLALPAKAVVEGVEKIGAKLGLRTCSCVTTRGGATLAAIAAERAAGRNIALSVSKEVTAKKILAIGGAAAMVVSTHEISDGIQAMGEGVGQVVKENPNIAVAMTEKIVAPAKFIAIVVGIGILIVASWFLWPCFSLICNWKKWCAAKKMKKYAQGTMPFVGEAMNCSHIGNSGKIHVPMVIVIGALSILTATCWLISQWNRGSTSIAKHREQVLDVGLREEVISSLRTEYERSIDKLYKDFKNDVALTSEAEFGKVKSSIPSVVEKFCTMSRCASLMKTIVTDKWNGDNAAEQSVRENLEADYYRGLYSSHDKVIDCIDRFHHKLEMTRISFASGITKELERGELPGDEVYTAMLIECGDRIEKAKVALANGQTGASFSVLIETACIRQTVATVAKILGKAAARQATTMASGAGMCIVDGPLPIGDCIAAVGVVGCTMWTGWEVYRATKILPNELTNTLSVATRECEQRSRDEAYEIGSEMYSRYSMLL